MAIVDADRRGADGPDAADDRVLRIVAEILESDGYDAVALRTVARRARTSLATIYKRYPTRDDLIRAALSRWMDEHRWAGLRQGPGDADESLYEGEMRMLRTIFEPWERHPGMLKAYYRARSAPGGDALVRRGFDEVLPASREVLAGVDPEFVADLDIVVSNVIYGLLGRFVAGEIGIADILPALERTVFRLTEGYRPAGTR